MYFSYGPTCIPTAPCGPRPSVWEPPTLSVSVVSWQTQTISATSPRQTPQRCITHTRHNASIRYYHLVIPEQRLVNWQRRTRIRREETGEELVGVSPPGTNPHSVKVSAGGDGDAQCGGSERFLTTGEKKAWFETAFPAGFIIPFSVWSFPFFPWPITPLSIGCHPPRITHRCPGSLLGENDAKRRERSRQSHFCGEKRGNDHLTKLIWFCCFFSTHLFSYYSISQPWSGQSPAD